MHIDDALAEDGTEEEEDRIVAQVLDEIGVSFGEEIPDAPLGVATNMTATTTTGPSKGGTASRRCRGSRLE